jgi:multidrug efflux pump
MESSADATGAGQITITFEPGTNVDVAQIDRP